ncbi:MAG: BON domain-containing protein [Pirellulales bacterium]|nr:BON domain-containing protein [Pirellulales bacterium]
MNQATAKDVGPQVRSALAESPVFDLHDVRVEHNGSGILLSGTVSSFYHKQLAQEVVRHVAGEIAVVNAIDVG